MAQIHPISRSEIVAISFILYVHYPNIHTYYERTVYIYFSYIHSYEFYVYNIKKVTATWIVFHISHLILMASGLKCIFVLVLSRLFGMKKL